MSVIFKRHLKEKNARVILFCTDSEHMFEMVTKVPEQCRCPEGRDCAGGNMAEAGSDIRRRIRGK